LKLLPDFSTDTNTQNNMNNLYAFQLRSSLLALRLQLAESDEKPKRSGDFESTYKNAAGNEVTIKRSPDGKFANKGGGDVILLLMDYVTQKIALFGWKRLARLFCTYISLLRRKSGGCDIAPEEAMMKNLLVLILI
jgi:hypothetical protein